MEDIEEEWVVKKDGICLDTPTFARMGSKPDSSTQEDCEKKKKKGFFDKFRIKDSLDYPTFLRVKAD